MAVLERLITGQATVLSFEHAFQLIALLFFAALLVVPLLGKARPDAAVAAQTDI